MAEDTRLLVIGGGIAGLASALFARHAGFDVALFEASAQATTTGVALGLAPNGMSVLGALGLAERLIAESSIVDTFAFETAQGRRLGTMPWGPEGRYRYPSISLSRRKLQAAVLEAAEAAGIPIRYGKALSGITEDHTGIVAHFADGSSERGFAMLGADGIHSAVRSVILPDGPAPAFTGLVGSGGFVPRRTMLDIVGGENERTMTFAFGSGAFVGHACGDRSAETGAYWWYALPRETPLDRQERAALTGSAVIEAVLAQDRWSPAIQQILRASTQILPAFNLFDVAHLPRWSAGRVGLIGDAAHAVSPHSGQGASMALEDAFAVVEALRRHRADPAIALQSFEAARRKRVERVVALGRRAGNEKRRGKVASAVMTAVMPIMLRLMPTPRWLYGWEAQP